MRQRISSNIRRSRLLFIVIGIGMLYDLLSSLINDNLDQDQVIVESIFIIVCCVLYYLFDRAKTIEFDSDFMYVNGKAGEDKIPLRNVYKIKLTMTEINNRSLWKIGYYDIDGLEKSVRILPRWFQQYFDEFKESVKNANKDVKIKNWSHSFDFDQ